MPQKIGDFVLAGELRNTRPNGVFGWIEFAPDYGIRIELTGNLSGQLAGKHIKFRHSRSAVTSAIEPGHFPEFVENLADRQIGVVGEMKLTRSNTAGELRPTAPDRPLVCDLYLEWFSQNGQVVAELMEASLEVIDESSNPEDDDEEDINQSDAPGTYISGFTEIHFDADGTPLGDPFASDEDEGEDDEEEEDPYGLFSDNLDENLAESLGTPASEDEAGNGQRRSWDEVLPGIDPETKAMYEQWDEIFEGKKDEPITYLFREPLKLPPPDRVTDDAQAEQLVKLILAQLALLSVALDVCEHFSPVDTYRLLMQEILPTAKVHPNLAASEMVQHYSTSDYCGECDAEFEAEMEGESTPDDDSDDS